MLWPNNGEHSEMGKKLRYQLHWAGYDSPRPTIKWVIYDWQQKPFRPVAYAESRVMGRKFCDILNAQEKH